MLILQDLTVSRAGATLAAGLTLNIGPGSALLLTGPNGAGKTSLLRVLAGLLEPTGGTLNRTGEAHFIAASPLAPSLETPRQYLSYLSALMGERFHIIADIFGIEPVLDAPLNTLSTGWRQRVKLTRLMLCDHPLWLLDEPSDGLDASGINALQRLVATHIEQGGAAIIATHDPHLWPLMPMLKFGSEAA